MVTLGQQLQQKRNGQTSGRVSRTQRVASQQEFQRAKNTYAREKAQADVLAEGLWKDVEYKEVVSQKQDLTPMRIMEILLIIFLLN